MEKFKMSKSFLKNDLIETLSESKFGFQRYLYEKMTRDIVRAEAQLDEAANPEHVRELELYMDNTNMVYQQMQRIEKMLYKKYKAGYYDHAKAMKEWSHVVDFAASAYQKEHGDQRTQIFTRDDRLELAKQLADHYQNELKTDSPDIQHHKEED